MKITVKRGLKFRIYPNKEQMILINKTLGCGRFVYNHFLCIQMDEWKYNHRSLQYKATNKMLTDLKKYPEYSWLKEVDSTSLQNSLRDLQKAYDNFFAKRAKFPRFKSKHYHEQSYRSQCTNDNIRVVENRIQLPKIGRVKTKFSREVIGKISNAVEKLNIKGMVKNKKLAKAISDAAWSKFFEKLAYKTKERGGELVKIPTFYPSSQTCHVCGFQNPIVKNLSVRDWACPQCGTYHDRDQNAAINILKKALSMKTEAA